MSGKRILLASVFKPCAVDDAYGRRENKPELMHNQLTMHQGIFSQRDRSHSHQLYVIANNVEAPVTVLDWPTLPRFEEELNKGYDYVGISFIQPNFLKAKKMVEVAREVSPRTKVIIGSFGTMIDDIESIMDVDHVCRGEGIGFMRKLLGEPEEYRFRHPILPTVAFLGVMGLPIRHLARFFTYLGYSKYSNAGGVIVTGVGCNEGCDFCSSGQFFSPRRIPFIQDGAEIYRLMKMYNELFGMNSFLLVGDENVFSDTGRMEQLHRCLQNEEKHFKIHLSFSSMNYLNQYDPKFLAEIGLDLVWIGIESKFRPYRKNTGVDIPDLLGELRKYGVKTILSSILCLDEHTQENIREDIDHHLSLNPVYSQFAHLSPAQGTVLWRKMKAEGRLLHAIPLEERHAFKQIWFKHPHFTPFESEQIQLEAYARDFHEFGPSFVRWIRANYEAYPHLINSGSEMLKRKAAWIKSGMPSYRILLRAAESLVPTEKMRMQVRDLRKEIEKDFGRMSAFERLVAAAIYPLGKGHEFRIRHFNEAIQPETVVTHFNKENRDQGPGVIPGNLKAVPAKHRW